MQLGGEAESDRARLMRGDCLERLKELPDNSVDAVVTDPPYGLGFMGKKWDYDLPDGAIWAECLRVLKPGGHLLAFAGTRTQHRMAVRIEDAGFEIRDMIAWIYGSGFPKSLDVSKAIDKAAGAEREIIGRKTGRAATPVADIRGGKFIGGKAGALDLSAITAPATDAARQWAGWGTALKPAIEPITVARKPLVGTVAANVLAHGVGALNIDGCRVAGAKPDTTRGASVKASSMAGPLGAQGRIIDDGQGRWPANLVLSYPADEYDLACDLADEDRAAFAHVLRIEAAAFEALPAHLRAFYRLAPNPERDEVERGFPATGKSTGGVTGKSRTASGWGLSGANAGATAGGFGDAGSASRYFYCAKASRKDRGEGNDHPTVKPLDLMRYLCRLVTPPGGLVLDPFAGSGSTGKAAVLEGFRFLGIERDEDYCDIAEARIAKAIESAPA